MAIQIENNEILDFVEYVDTFYNPVNGVFPIKGATIKVITEAIKTYIGQIEEFNVEFETIGEIEHFLAYNRAYIRSIEFKGKIEKEEE